MVHKKTIFLSIFRDKSVFSATPSYEFWIPDRPESQNFSDWSKDCFEKLTQEKIFVAITQKFEIWDCEVKISKNKRIWILKWLHIKSDSGISNSRVTLIPTIVLDWAMMQEKIYRRSWQKRFLFLCTFAYLALSTSK